MPSKEGDQEITLGVLNAIEKTATLLKEMLPRILVSHLV